MVIFMFLALTLFDCLAITVSRKTTYDLKDLELCFRFDNVRIPRENLLNSVADVSPEGKYLSAIKDPDQVVLLSNGHICVPIFLFFPLLSKAVLSIIYRDFFPLCLVCFFNSEICSILGSIDIWTCNYSNQCNLHIKGSFKQGAYNFLQIILASVRILRVTDSRFIAKQNFHH